MKGENRFYRNLVSPDHLVPFHVRVEETDLQVFACRDLSVQTRESVLQQRYRIQSFIRKHPDFLSSLTPLSFSGHAPPIVREMLDAGRRAGVGPMAAVAGAVAASVGADLLKYSDEVIVENGGDIFLRATRAVTIGIFAGDSPFSLQIGLKLPAMERPTGVCTSSGTVGHSLSMGRADGVCVIADNCALADATATAIGNRVRTAADIGTAMDFGRSITELRGIVIILGDKIGAWGDIEMVPVNLTASRRPR